VCRRGGDVTSLVSGWPAAVDSPRLPVHWLAWCAISILAVVSHWLPGLGACWLALVALATRCHGNRPCITQPLQPPMAGQAVHIRIHTRPVGLLLLPLAPVAFRFPALRPGPLVLAIPLVALLRLLAFAPRILPLLRRRIDRSPLAGHSMRAAASQSLFSPRPVNAHTGTFASGAGSNSASRSSGVSARSRTALRSSALILSLPATDTTRPTSCGCALNAAVGGKPINIVMGLESG
jgi:hypothetical protein